MKKIFIILLCLSSVAVAQDGVITRDDSQLLGDISARITALEEENRKLYGRIEELEHKLKTSAKDSGSLQGKQDYYSTKPGNANSEYVIRLKEPEEELPFAKAADSEDEEKFNEAFAHIGKQDFESAKTDLNKFIEENPDSQYTSQSYFWLGEIARKEKANDVAAINYLKGYKSDPKGKRASESLVKLVQSLSALGKTEQACNNIARYNQEFPNEHFDLSDKIKDESAKLNCK